MNNINEKWDRRFMELARHISTWSKDPSTKVGCVIVNPHNRSVLSTGYNGFAPGADDDPALYADRVYKLAHVRHAETNAASFLSCSPIGTYVYTSFPCCPDCLSILGRLHVARVAQPPLPLEGRSDSWIREWANKVGLSRRIAQDWGMELVTIGGDT